MLKDTIDNRILQYLLEGNRINQWTAIETFRYTRLSASIHNLKQKGYNIRDEWLKAPNGKKYKDYWLVEKVVPKTVEREEDSQAELGLNVKKRFEWPD